MFACHNFLPFTVKYNILKFSEIKYWAANTSENNKPNSQGHANTYFWSKLANWLNSWIVLGIANKTTNPMVL